MIFCLVEFQEVVRRLNEKLGFSGNEILDFKDVKWMFTTCRYEKAKNPDFSAWCSPFEMEDLLVSKIKLF